MSTTTTGIVHHGRSRRMGIFLLWILMGSSLWFVLGAAAEFPLGSAQIMVPSTPPPKLSGRHFRITVVQEDGFVDFYSSSSSSSISTTTAGDIPTSSTSRRWGVRGGYCIDIIETLAYHANFTFELRPPSGMGSLCRHSDESSSSAQDQSSSSSSSNNNSNRSVVPYAHNYRSQYLCGQSDVNDRPNNNNNNNNNVSTTTASPTTQLLAEEYATDMYLGLFYVTPERQLQNLFSMSFHPPTTGAITLFGNAIEIANVDDLIRQQQQQQQQQRNSGDSDKIRVCVLENTAFAQYIAASFSHLETIPYDPSTMGDYYESFASGACQIQIADNPVATRFILEQQRKGRCFAKGMPLGIITDPLTFGFSQYAIGIRKDMDREVVDTINYWMNYLMTCAPNLSSNDSSSGGAGECQSFAEFYPEAGGTGKECGYVAYPPSPLSVEERLLSPGAIAGVALGALVLIVTGLWVSHVYLLAQQRKRYKLRFVQQIARNISIGPSPRHIEAEKLVEEIQHISNRPNGVIAKDDLWKWMFDIKLHFISDKDFDALWHAIDVDGDGVVEPLEFFVFLSLCGPEFEQVSKEIANMPKIEKLKWASRRLTNYRLNGVQGVRKMEYDLERRSRQQNIGTQNNGGGITSNNLVQTPYHHSSSLLEDDRETQDDDDGEYPSTPSEYFNAGHPPPPRRRPSSYTSSLACPRSSTSVSDSLRSSSVDDGTNTHTTSRISFEQLESSEESVLRDDNASGSTGCDEEQPSAGAAATSVGSDEDGRNSQDDDKSKNGTIVRDSMASTMTCEA